MCLGVSGQVIEWLNHDPIFGRAVIEFGGIRKDVEMACVPEAVPGDYVIVHAGIAICRLNVQEAERAIAEFQRLVTYHQPSQQNMERS